MLHVLSQLHAKLLIDGARQNGMHLVSEPDSNAEKYGKHCPCFFVDEDLQETPATEDASNLLEYIFSNNYCEDEESLNQDVIEYILGQVEDLSEMA